MSSATGIVMTGRVFSITGGASGIGLATAKLLARHGAAAIWIADIQSKLFDKVGKELSEINKDTKFYFDKIDVGDSLQVDQWVQRIVAESGGLHGAANVAGVTDQILRMGGKEPVTLSIDDDQWRRIFRINTEGVMYCVRAEIRAMLKMDKGSNPAIVNVASIAGITPGAGSVSYGASKAACVHFTQSVGKDLSGRGVRINGVLPGAVWTPMLMRATGQFPDMSDAAAVGPPAGSGILMPEEVAEAIVWMLSEKCLNLNGVCLPIGEVKVSNR
ncbi:hypothetical protein PspLS_11859 [Pyricularia sp. CBS 133598]|nr:hypothetical protein PspLS_11859 [Pyricularia sp. CBS 133598]